MKWRNFNFQTLTWEHISESIAKNFVKMDDGSVGNTDRPCRSNY